MKISELARKLNKSRRTIYNWIDSGKIKARRNFDKSYYIPKAEVDRLMKEAK